MAGVTSCRWVRVLNGRSAFVFNSLGPENHVPSKHREIQDDTASLLNFRVTKGWQFSYR